MANERDRNVRPGLINGLADVKMFFLAVKTAGPLSAIKKIMHVITWRLHTRMDRNFDRDFGVQTSSHAFSWDLELQSEGDDIGTEEPMYLPTSSLAFRRIMSCLPENFGNLLFIDYGSGKGRTLLLAAEYNFKKIIGVEFGKELHDIAEKNILNYRSPKRRCDDINSVLIDATLYELPDEPCVLYFFNPFEESVMRKVIKKIRASYFSNPRRMILVYYKPKFPEIFQEQDFIHESMAGKRSYLFPNPYGLIIYETQES